MIQSYIAVDLETTGLNPKQDKIIEIGAIRVVAGKVAQEFHTLIQPHRDLDERIVSLTGITKEMLIDAPDLNTVLESFLEFSKDLPLLGHNIMFDYRFLKQAAVNQKLEFERAGIDTLYLCRRFMPKAEKKSLESACAYFHILRRRAHRALEDAKDAHALYQELRRRFGGGEPQVFEEKPLIYKVKREQPASKKQKEGLRDLAKYHRIDLSAQIDYLSRNEASRMMDQLIAQYGRMK